MADVVDKKTRSRMMAGIRGKDTKPEMLVRKGLHRLGFRFRLHDRKLPGRPDLVLPKYNAVLFVNGCFWHGHECHLFKWPATRRKFWRDKIEGNKARDKNHIEALRELGWRVLVVHECALKGRERMAEGGVVVEVADWLESGAGKGDIAG